MNKQTVVGGSWEITELHCWLLLIFYQERKDFFSSDSLDEQAPRALRAGPRPAETNTADGVSSSPELRHILHHQRLIVSKIKVTRNRVNYQNNSSQLQDLEWGAVKGKVCLIQLSTPSFYMVFEYYMKPQDFWVQIPVVY